MQNNKSNVCKNIVDKIVVEDKIRREFTYERIFKIDNYLLKELGFQLLDGDPFQSKRLALVKPITKKANQINSTHINLMNLAGINLHELSYVQNSSSAFFSKRS